MPRIHVLDVPEFAGIVQCARKQEGVRVAEARGGYFTISSDHDLEFSRRACGFKPAVWYTCLSGGIHGHIAHYGRNTLRVVDAAKPEA